MSTINRTFSIPKDVDHDLHLFVKNRNMSRFVAESIREKLQKKHERLAQDYIDSSNDEADIEVMKDWECTMADGLGEDNDW